MTHASVFSGIGEQWKPIDGYEGKYEVSDQGNVRSLDYGLMQPHKINSGYLIVGLRNQSGKRQCLVHRLVARAFIPNPDNLPQINHKDEDKTNNHVGNLEWCTIKYNNNYGNAKKKLSETHLNHPNLSKAVVSTDKEGNTTIYQSANEAARQTGINVSNIVRCCNKVKNYHTAGGYKWEYQQ